MKNLWLSFIVSKEHQAVTGLSQNFFARSLGGPSCWGVKGRSGTGSNCPSLKICMSNSNWEPDTRFFCLHLLKGSLPEGCSEVTYHTLTDTLCSGLPIYTPIYWPELTLFPAQFDGLQSPSSQEHSKDRAMQLPFWVRALSFLPTALNIQQTIQIYTENNLPFAFYDHSSYESFFCSHLHTPKQSQFFAAHHWRTRSQAYHQNQPGRQVG